MSASTNGKPRGVGFTDHVIFWGALSLWMGVFLAGTLVNSQPFRNEFTKLGGVIPTIVSGVEVAVTYTLTNVCVLCLLASLLGMIGGKAQLGADSERPSESDQTSPAISALLRGFFVYLTLIAGVLVLNESPTEPTQIQYVKLAGFMSLVAFVVNYHPRLFGKLLAKSVPSAETTAPPSK